MESNLYQHVYFVNGTTLTVNEGATTLSVPLAKPYNSIPDVVVQYTTETNGLTLPAVSGIDFEPASGTITWQNGDMSNKIITITLKDPDFVIKNPRQFAITLTPVSATILNTTLTVTINDNDEGLSQQFFFVLFFVFIFNLLNYFILYFILCTCFLHDVDCDNGIPGPLYCQCNSGYVDVYGNGTKCVSM